MIRLEDYFKKRRYMPIGTIIYQKFIKIERESYYVLSSTDANYMNLIGIKDNENPSNLDGYRLSEKVRVKNSLKITKKELEELLIECDYLLEEKSYNLYVMENVEITFYEKKETKNKISRFEMMDI